ncbi:hypothetical protein BLNAU_16381 [Blattamonas nauphoetae]|uniref:Uncharacterized protein n=1 Tax=Blattamonas nauphoetae TaxID=2049346 RepID=A0ABQ9X8D8_9EUKA|nr:hypothetical protein BLNAU_16381 [Blattamonas nauphoetae]
MMISLLCDGGELQKNVRQDTIQHRSSQYGGKEMDGMAGNHNIHVKRHRQIAVLRSHPDTSKDDSEASEDVLAEFTAVLDPCSVVTVLLALPSASPLTTLGVVRAGGCLFEAQAILASALPFSMDCSPFMNRDEAQFKTVDEQAVVFRSLVATLKFQPALDASLETKAVKLLESVSPVGEESALAFLNSLWRTPDESLTTFIQSIDVLISSPNQIITTTTMKLLESLMSNSSKRIRLALVKADLIPQLINTINPLSLSFVETDNIHINLMISITRALWLATPLGLEQLRIEDDNEQQAVYETLLKQVLVPSENYICLLCVNRCSIVDGKQSETFIGLLARLLAISPCYEPTMEIVLHMPVFLTIPSCLTFFENENSITYFLDEMSGAQEDWNISRGEYRQMWKKVHQMLRMEGMDDVVEARLQNDKNGEGRWVDFGSIEWNNLQGMNLPKQE